MNRIEFRRHRPLGVPLFGVFLYLASSAAFGASPTDVDRQRIIAHLEMTERWLAGEVKGLSDAQLKFRPNPTAWSVLDCVEHLAIAEPQYWTDLMKAMKEPIKPNFKSATTDGEMLWYGIDRTQRQKTGEARVPKSRYSDVQTPLGEFRKLRAAMLDYARTTSEDWRAHNFYGSDAYQWFVMISSHSQRHILQIREIKADPGFPKK